MENTALRLKELIHLHVRPRKIDGRPINSDSDINLSIERCPAWDSVHTSTTNSTSIS